MEFRVWEHLRHSKVVFVAIFRGLQFLFTLIVILLPWSILVVASDRDFPYVTVTLFLVLVLLGSIGWLTKMSLSRIRLFLPNNQIVIFLDQKAQTAARNLRTYMTTYILSKRFVIEFLKGLVLVTGLVALGHLIPTDPDVRFSGAGDISAERLILSFAIVYAMIPPRIRRNDTD